MRRPVIAALGAVVCLFTSLPAQAIDCPRVAPPLPSPTGLIPGYNDPRPAYPWAGAFEACPVTLPSARNGARLYGVLHFPADVENNAGRLPGIVIGPGSGQGVQAGYQWLARYLAAQGYVALTVDPQGVGYSETTALQGAGGPGLEGVPFQQLGNYIDALRSGLDFLQSPLNPLADWTRSWGFGLAGHSLSARAASTLQGTDDRVAAIVALDNLSSHREGDAGIMSGGGLIGALAGGEVSLSETPNLPRVPALALASDRSPWVDPSNTDPALKKTGYAFWRSQGITAMVLVLRGSAHSDFSRKPGDNIPLHEPAAYYADAWFDWHLNNLSAPPALLLADSVAGFGRDALLSTTFQSAAFFPAQAVDCPDLLAEPCALSGTVNTSDIQFSEAGGGCTPGRGGRRIDLLFLLLAPVALWYLHRRRRQVLVR